MTTPPPLAHQPSPTPAKKADAPHAVPPHGSEKAADPIRPPFTVHHISGYGRTAWQVRGGGGHVISRLVSEMNARKVAHMLTIAAELEEAVPSLAFGEQRTS